MREHMTIPLVAPLYSDADRDAVMEASLHLDEAEQYVTALENRLADMYGAVGCVATTSGTAGLYLALMATQGMDVPWRLSLPAYSCVALLHASKTPGATIWLEDCIYSPATMEYNLHDWSNGHIRPNMFGVQCDWEDRECIIEDWAMALGATPAVIRGQCAIFSFHSSKMVSGQHGGAVVTNNPDLLARLRDLNSYNDAVVRDRLNDKPVYRQAVNYRMSGLNAALVRSQLDQLPTFVARRRKIADYYNDALVGCPAILPTKVPEGSVFGRYIMALTTKHPVDVIRALAEKGIEAGRGVYPTLDMYLGRDPKDYPNAHKAVETVLSLPVYAALTDAEVQYVAEVAKEILCA